MRRERRVNELMIILAGGSVSIYVFSSHLFASRFLTDLAVYPDIHLIQPFVRPFIRLADFLQWQSGSALIPLVRGLWDPRFTTFWLPALIRRGLWPLFGTANSLYSAWPLSIILVRPIAVIWRGQRPLFGVATVHYLVRPIAVIWRGQRPLFGMATGHYLQRFIAFLYPLIKRYLFYSILFSYREILSF